MKHGNLIKDDEGFIGIITGIIGLIVLALCAGAIVKLIIGLLMLAGIVFLFLSIFILYRNKWELNWIFGLFIVIGLVLIGFSAMNLEIAYVDLSMIPGMKELHVWANQIITNS